MRCGIGRGNKPSHAMPDKEQRQCRKCLAGMLDCGIDIAQVVLKGLHVPSRPIRPAMPAKIEAIDSVPRGTEFFRCRIITSSMLAQRMEKYDDAVRPVRDIPPQKQVKTVWRSQVHAFEYLRHKRLLSAILAGKEGLHHEKASLF